MNSPDSSEATGSEDKTGLPPISPDFVEQDWPEELDNIIPSRGYQMTPMVGLGGSAGSIQALVEFFKAMLPESGMIFVVILHLSPTHQSTMAELLAASTRMKVLQVPSLLYLLQPMLPPFARYIWMRPVPVGSVNSLSLTPILRSTHSSASTSLVTIAVIGMLT